MSTTWTNIHNKSLCMYMLSYLLGKHLEIKLLGHRIGACLTYEKTVKYLPKACVHICSNFRVFLYLFFSSLQFFFYTHLWYGIRSTFLKGVGKKRMQKREKWKSKTKKIFSKHIFSKCINYLYYQITFNFTMGFFLVKFSENIYIFICFIKNPPLISTVSFQHVCCIKWTLSVFQNWENHPYWAKAVTWKTQLWAELDYYLPSSLWVFPFIYSSWPYY